MQVQGLSDATNQLRKMGFSDFKPGQQEALEALLAGKDTQVILPTGAGKSLIYQLYSQLSPGLVLVVSPLIALMHDQMASLRALKIQGFAINSHMKPEAINQALLDISNNSHAVVFVTPERFENDRFLGWLKHQRVSLFVVDEAHCISEWGHDFRPAYNNLGEVRRLIENPLTLTLTATATKFVVSDITEKLKLRNPEIIVRGVDRPNLFYEVRRVYKEKEIGKEIVGLLSTPSEKYPESLQQKIRTALEGSGILYVSTTKEARRLAHLLCEEGYTADYYHGQRRKADRERVQNAFMHNEIRIIVATNAFGLGVDKPDIRFVIHRDMPASLEAYYQEVGRAGRDGNFAFCAILQTGRGYGRAAFLGGSGDEKRKEYERGRLAVMRSYLEAHTCRRLFLLNYFLEPYTKATCKMCDNEYASKKIRPVARDVTKLKPVTVVHDLQAGDSVTHSTWGTGTVQRVEKNTVTALFEKIGSKSFDVRIARKNNLLH